MKRRILGLIVVAVLACVNSAAAYEDYQKARADRLYGHLAPLPKVARKPVQDCEFCMTGWTFQWADSWTYFDPVTEYTDHYIESCSTTLCFHECSATRSVPGGEIIGIFDCHIMQGSCISEYCP